MQPAEALYKAGWRADFRRSLVAQGISVNRVNDITRKMVTYLNRIKENRMEFQKLCSAVNIEELSSVLHHIFEVSRVGFMRQAYKEIPDYIYMYLDFLLSAEAYYGVYLSEEDHERIAKLCNAPLPQTLSDFETPYMKNGMLEFLAHPQLLCMIREGKESGLSAAQLSIRCQTFYRNALPQMQASDYMKLLTKWKGVGRDNMFELTFPDGRVVRYRNQEALCEVVSFYGAENVRRKRLKTPKGEDLIISSSLELDSPKIDGLYLTTIGEFKACHRMLNMINALFGGRIVIKATVKE